MMEFNEKDNKPLYPEPYKVKNNCLYIETAGSHGVYDRKLCNFAPYLKREVTVDDGLEVTKRLVLSGTLENGRELPEIEVGGAELAGFNWLLEKWGVGCVLEVGRTVKENVRHAIQLTAENAERTSLYTVTGWKKIDGKWHYLLPNNPDYDVSLSGKLSRYCGESFFSEKDVSLLYSMLVLPPVKREILLPLLAYTFLTPLGEFLKRAGCEPRFVLFLTGHTGARKSTLAALFLSFFGQFSAGDLPLSFRDTANSILHNAFTLKDVLTCVDDYHPSSRQEESKLSSTAQTVMRAYGDRTGRGRLRADSSLMESRPPQGNAIVTAEFAPDIGESGTARYFSLELKKSDVDLDNLSAFQTEAERGGLRRVMKAYTDYIKMFLCKEKFERQFIDALRQKFIQNRDDFLKNHPETHGRICEAVAWLKLGFDLFLHFLDEYDMTDPIKNDELIKEFSQILSAQAAAQSSSVTSDKPTRLFLRKLGSLLESGTVQLLSRQSPFAPAGGSFIGWEDDEKLYLNSDSAVRAVKKLCDEEGVRFTITPRSLLKALAEEGLIETNGGRSTSVIYLNGKTKRVITLSKQTLKEVSDE